MLCWMSSRPDLGFGNLRVENGHHQREIFVGVVGEKTTKMIAKPMIVDLF